MEIPVITRIAHFDGGVDISQTLFLPGVVAVSKWTPLIFLALAAAVAGLVTTVKLFVFRVRSGDPLFQSQKPQIGFYDIDADTASSSDDDEEESDEDEDDEVADDFRRRVDGDFVDHEQWQSRKLWLRHRRSSGDVSPFPDLAGGKSVVKLWDNLDLGFDTFDLLTGISPPVVVSAAGGDSRRVEVKVWDRRVSCRVPAVLAEWRAQSREIVRHNVYGFEKIFIAGEVTVGDIRKAGTALDNVTGWDVDAVNLTDGLGVTRCCDAVRSHLLLGNGK